MSPSWARPFFRWKVIGRRNTAGDGLRRIYLNEPRSYRFTTTLEF